MRKKIGKGGWYLFLVSYTILIFYLGGVVVDVVFTDEEARAKHIFRTVTFGQKAKTVEAGCDVEAIFSNESYVISPDERYEFACLNSTLIVQRFDKGLGRSAWLSSWK